jgi:hypothetical protein
MWLGGDPDAIARMAQRLRELRETLAADGARVQVAATTTVWQSVAAGRFRAQIESEIHSYRGVSQHLDEAAAALDHLAATLRDRQAELSRLASAAGRSIEEIYREAVSAGEDVLSFAGNLADQAVHAMDDIGTGAKHVLDDVTGGFL